MVLQDRYLRMLLTTFWINYFVFSHLNGLGICSFGVLYSVFFMFKLFASLCLLLELQRLFFLACLLFRSSIPSCSNTVVS